MAAFLFHALNGIRVILVDFWSQGPRYQKQMTYGVLGIWVVLFVPLRDPSPVQRLRIVGRATMTTLQANQLPTPRTRPAKANNFELNSWLFMRASGVLLVILVFGHLFVNLMLGEGIHRIDFAFVAGKWTNPFWQVWDLAMLWLAQLHGVQRPAHDHQRLRQRAGTAASG